MLLVPLVAAILLLVPSLAEAAPPTISANPQSVFVGPDGSGDTTISWNTGDGSNGEVWVSVHGADEVQMAGAPSGSQGANFIGLGPTVFTLRAAGHGPALASVEVTGVKAGTISATDEHLVVPEGGASSTTVQWAMNDGAPTAEVWVSVNGDPEVHMSSGASGSNLVPWIQRGTTTFSLYRGANRDELIDTLVVTGDDGTTDLPATPVTPGQVGFSYWPSEVHNVQFLNDENWPRLRETVAHDLDQIASAGGSVIRTNLHPELSEYFDTAAAPTDCSTPTAAALDWCEQIANLPDFLSLAAQRGIKVILVFSNSFLTGSHWPALAGFGQHDWPAFTEKSVKWMNGYVDAVEASPFADSILYYDLQAESSSHTAAPNVVWPYVSRMIDGTHAPRERRGLSVLHAITDGPTLKRVLGPRRKLAFVDVRAYEQMTVMTQAADEMRPLFPETNVILGEFGKIATSPATEAAQADFARSRLAQQQIAEFPVALFWEFNDDTDPNPLASVGWGAMYDESVPKDVLGVLCDAWSLIANCDMEAIGPGGPTGMAATGAGATLSSGTADPAVGQRFARVTASGSPGEIGVFSDPVDVPRGRLSANAFVRSSASSVALEVREYDSNDVLVDTTRFDPAATGPTEWVNLLQESPDPTSLFLGEDTESVSIGVVVPNAGAAATLDVDALMAGVNAAPAAELSDSTLAFGSQLQGTASAPQLVTLSNNGTADLAIASISLAGAHPTQFTMDDSNCTGTGPGQHNGVLDPSESCTAAIRFTPTSAGGKSATLGVSTTGGTMSVSLAGTGTAPTIPPPAATTPPAATPAPAPAASTPTVKKKKKKKKKKKRK